MKLYTYTNADEVELLLNGKSLGRKRNDVGDTKARNRIVWDGIPYKAGRIEARAYRDGQPKPVATHQLQTTGKATRLSATPDNAAWQADGMDLQHVKIEALDSKGRRDRQAAGLVTFKVDGPAEIVGVINGDINSNELTVGDTRSLYNGAATVILRSTTGAGPVTLTATAPGLRPAVLKMATD